MMQSYCSILIVSLLLLLLSNVLAMIGEKQLALPLIDVLPEITPLYPTHWQLNWHISAKGGELVSGMSSDRVWLCDNVRLGDWWHHQYPVFYEWNGLDKRWNATFFARSDCTGNEYIVAKEAAHIMPKLPIYSYTVANGINN